MPKPDPRAAATPPAPVALPRHIVLADEWGHHPVGRVLAADADLIAALDIAGVRYRPATEIERGLAGFPG